MPHPTEEQLKQLHELKASLHLPMKDFMAKIKAMLNAYGFYCMDLKAVSHGIKPYFSICRGHMDSDTCFIVNGQVLPAVPLVTVTVSLHYLEIGTAPGLTIEDAVFTVWLRFITYHPLDQLLQFMENVSDKDLIALFCFE